MGSEGAAIVPKRRTQPRKMSEANNGALTSLKKSCKELPRIGDRLRPARFRAGTHSSFGVRSWKNGRKDYCGEVRMVKVPGWTGPNRVWIPKCSDPNELARGIDAALFFSGEEPHYFYYPEGYFHSSELENAEETETGKSFFGRVVEKYSKDDRELTERTPISAPASASYTAEESATAEESEDNANPHRNPTKAESSTNVTDYDVWQYSGEEPCGILLIDMKSDSAAMPGAQNHSPDGIMSCYEVDLPAWLR